MNGLVELAGNPVTSPTLTSTIISLLAQLGSLSVYMGQCHWCISLFGCFTLCVFLLFCTSRSELIIELHFIASSYMEFACSTHHLDTGFLSGLYSLHLPDHLSLAFINSYFVKRTYLSFWFFCCCLSPACDDASREILHCSYNCTSTLAAVIQHHSTTPGEPLVLQVSSTRSISAATEQYFVSHHTKTCVM